MCMLKIRQTVHEITRYCNICFKNSGSYLHWLVQAGTL